MPVETKHQRRQRLRMRSGKPASVDTAAHRRVLARLQPFSLSEIADLALPVRTSWTKILASHGQDVDWHNLACVANLCLVQGESIHPDCVELANDSIAALEAMRDRHQRVGVWGPCHLSLKNIPSLMDFYEQLLAMCTPLQIQQTMITVLKRMREQRAMETAK